MESTKSTIFAEIHDIIEELTTTGSENDLDQEYMNKLKRHCKSSHENLKVTYDILMNQLAKKHCEIRYSTFQIIDELFLRSHAFRTMIIFDLQTIFLLAFESEPVSQPLPPPLKAAKSLIKLALRKFYKWYKMYGKYYRKLQLGYEYLIDVKKVKFTDAEHVSREEQLRQKQLAEKNEKLRQSKLEQVDMQYADKHADIETNIKQIENCFQLLLPKVELQEDSSLEKQQDSRVENLSEAIMTDVDCFSTSSNDVLHTLGAETAIHNNYAVSIELPKKHVIEACDDNKVIISQTKEVYKELKSELEHVKRWLRVLIKCDCKDKEKLQKLLDLKNTIVSKTEQYRELNIGQFAGSDSEDDFIDVPESGVSAEPNSKSNRVPANRIQSEMTSLHQDQASASSSSSSSSLSRREKLLQVAPVVSYDSDLRHWGDEKAAAAPSTFAFNSIEQFWWNTDYKEYSETPKTGDAMMKVRKIEFIGKQAPIQRKCGAPLPNGKFCERMDRVKCPFHGKIIDRDRFGAPMDGVERERELKRTHKREREERDSIQKEIDAALGTNLSNKKRKKESKTKTRYARLTNIKTDKVKKGMSKLEQKIFSKKALDKVSKSLDAVSSMIHDGKFGSQFNYRNDSFIGQ